MSSDTEQFQQEKRRSLFFLSILCFALADVRDGLGPFLGVFLQSEGWTPDTIGFVASLGGFAGMAAAVPAGAFADATRQTLLPRGSFRFNRVPFPACTLHASPCRNTFFSGHAGHHGGIHRAASLRNHTGHGRIQKLSRPPWAQ